MTSGIIEDTSSSGGARITTILSNYKGKEKNREFTQNLTNNKKFREIARNLKIYHDISCIHLECIFKKNPIWLFFWQE